LNPAARHAIAAPSGVSDDTGTKIVTRPSTMPTGTSTSAIAPWLATAASPIAARVSASAVSAPHRKCAPL